MDGVGSGCLECNRQAEAEELPRHIILSLPSGVCAVDMIDVESQAFKCSRF